jgi:hypothetical protein
LYCVGERGKDELEIRVEGYDMSKEEMISKIVELTVEKSVLDLQLKGLSLLLQAKGILTEEELKNVYKQILDNVKENAEAEGVLTDKFEEYVKARINL